MLYNGPPLSPLKLPLPWGFGPNLTHDSLVPSEPTTLKIDLSLTFFVRLIFMLLLLIYIFKVQHRSSSGCVPVCILTRSPSNTKYLSSVAAPIHGGLRCQWMQASPSASLFTEEPSSEIATLSVYVNVT